MCKCAQAWKLKFVTKLKSHGPTYLSLSLMSINGTRNTSHQAAPLYYINPVLGFLPLILMD